MTLSPSTLLDDFEILGPLGAGGMGEVFRARDLKLKRQVAFKILPPYVSQDPDWLRRFEQEAQAAAALSHPNIADASSANAGNYLLVIPRGFTIHLGPLSSMVVRR
jgi:serine/threonine protein kinase